MQKRAAPFGDDEPLWLTRAAAFVEKAVLSPCERGAADYPRAWRWASFGRNTAAYETCIRFQSCRPSGSCSGPTPHYRRTRTWPQVRSGTIIESPADNWSSVENALRIGLRGLPGGSSLKRFLADHRRDGRVPAVAPRPATAKRAPVSPKRRKPR